MTNGDNNKRQSITISEDALGNVADEISKAVKNSGFNFDAKKTAKDLLNKFNKQAEDMKKALPNLPQGVQNIL